MHRLRHHRWVLLLSLWLTANGTTAPSPVEPCPYGGPGVESHAAVPHDQGGVRPGAHDRGLPAQAGADHDCCDGMAGMTPAADADASRGCNADCLASAACGSSGATLLARPAARVPPQQVRFHGSRATLDPLLIPAHTINVWRPPRSL